MLREEEIFEQNGFDAIKGFADQTDVDLNAAKLEEEHNKLDYLIHQVFEQNPLGKELLTIWKEALIMKPTVTPHSTQFQVGIEEGKKEFIRKVCLTITKVEGQ